MTEALLPVPLDQASLRLGPHGAQHHPGAVNAILHDLLALCSRVPPRRAGARLFDVAPLRPLLAPSGPIAALAAGHLGANTRAVRALLFDKRADSNWSLAWHQDRVVALCERLPVDGFTNWTVKSGVVHASPPWGLLRRMITLRIHLDPVAADNAPLLVAPGSHRLGLIRESAIDATVRSCGIVSCLADAGDVWAYSTPILHASDATRTDAPRRVLQLDFAAFDLPGGLTWRGI